MKADHRALRRAVTLAAAMCLAGCVTPHGGIAPVRDAWFGASYDEVVSRWGTPVRSTSLNDGRLAYTWFSEGAISRGALRPSIGISAGSGTGVGIGIGIGSDTQRDTYVTCERTLFFRDGRVVEQTWFGPASFCAGFKRY